MSKRRSPSPAPTITLDVTPKPEITRSGSEDSIRVVHQPVVFPNSPYTYIRRSFETDSDIVTRQLAAIALQPLTFAEQLAERRKQLEVKAEKRKREKAAKEALKIGNSTVPEIMVAPPSGKPNEYDPSATTIPPASRGGKFSPSYLRKATMQRESRANQKLQSVQSNTTNQQNNRENKVKTSRNGQDKRR